LGAVTHLTGCLEGRVSKAIVKIDAVSGSQCKGTITITQEKDGLRIHGTVEGLTPGNHGFHIHEFGDCSALDASSAGGHFNPTRGTHGGPHDPNRHIGDLGNIYANENGVATIDDTAYRIRLNGPHSIIGRSIIIHASEDDLRTQPAGAAGSRIGCGVIGRIQ